MYESLSAKSRLNPPNVISAQLFYSKYSANFFPRPAFHVKVPLTVSALPLSHTKAVIYKHRVRSSEKQHYQYLHDTVIRRHKKTGPAQCAGPVFPRERQIPQLSVIIPLGFEIRLRMQACRTCLRSFLTFEHITAVAALPFDFLLAFEIRTVFHTLQQL